VRWLADECVAASVVDKLRDGGHDVLYVAETDPSASDSDIATTAMREQRLLLTEDKDFGELIFRWRRAVPGVVLLRIISERRDQKWPRLAVAIERYGETMFGRYTVVEEGRLRSRRLG
jgi:predicted nuclease of predicted toxin-antitoxin system